MLILLVFSLFSAQPPVNEFDFLKLAETRSPSLTWRGPEKSRKVLSKIKQQTEIEELYLSGIQKTVGAKVWAALQLSLLASPTNVICYNCHRILRSTVCLGYLNSSQLFRLFNTSHL